MNAATELTFLELRGDRWLLKGGESSAARELASGMEDTAASVVPDISHFSWDTLALPDKSELPAKPDPAPVGLVLVALTQVVDVRKDHCAFTNEKEVWEPFSLLNEDTMEIQGPLPEDGTVQYHLIGPRVGNVSWAVRRERKSYED